MTRNLLRALAALVVLAAAGLIGWRVLGPAEVLEPATGAYPVAAALPPGATGKVTQAPLIVDDRIRVYAGERLVKADGPVDEKMTTTPLWSYRRWPARLSGVVAVGSTVVSRWADGELVALDGRTGTVAWRAHGPAGEPFTDRTGATAVWTPPGLYVVGPAVLVGDSGKVLAFSAADGSPRWTITLPRGCVTPFVTGGGQFVCGAGAWDVTSGEAVRSWPVGPSAPVGCDVARSRCAGLRDAAGQGWLTGGPGPVRTPALDAPGATAGGTLVLTASGGAVTASGSATWRWTGAAQVLGVRGTKVVLLTPDRRIVVLDARTGTQTAAFPMYVKRERSEPWQPHLWQLTDSYVVVERLQGDDYYLPDPSVIAAI
ncbi:PQQ-binding-like beta-propeller repeat protein [Couchioplanes caeruleus]|uniref:outer membrane protein assembly factor BamB family protein n=1 Tax=Couchioplanes caeruleus TaxID=56438 RepID=UPI0020BD819F|nr:PQQ-binding-like beta-propeller repeat protein [Couchioplanes caeruleus]UQU65304.1 PQQ-binding-like beta-propeller repeat protein [Couchioplanes caeruleus]